MIEFDNVSLTLGSFSLKNISLTINEGDYYFILGPSGAGKTVILEAIAGLHRPDSGSVLVRGEDLCNKPPEKRKISLVYQDYSLFPHMTVFDNVAFGLKMQKCLKSEIRMKVDDILDRFNISHLRDRHPLTMSGGEQQRVALARSLVVNPEILLLDEPLSALDPLTHEKFISDLRSLHKEQGLTIVHVSHSRQEALSLANNVAVIIDGRLEQEDTVEGVFNRPSTEEVGRFVGIENIFRGRVNRNDDSLINVDVCGVNISAVGNYPDGTVVNLFIRGEDIMLFQADGAVTSARNTLEGEITDSFHVGSVVRVNVDCGIPVSVLVTRQSFEEMNLITGKKVIVRFKATAVHAVPVTGSVAEI